MRTFTILAALLAAISSAAAQRWPTRPVILVVPFAAGGSSDAIGRIMAGAMSGPLGQPIAVENVPGSGGMAGGTRVARGAPDGYQFVIGNVGSFAQSQ
jgi:tripartite-type tricarboxylate transporter receptor subunit TctC